MGWKYRVKQVLCRFCSVHKAVYYRLDRTLVQKSENATEFTTDSGHEVSVEEIVRDLYDGNQTELTFYENYVRQGIERWTAHNNEKIAGVVWLYTGYYLAQWEGYKAWLLHVNIDPADKFVCNVFVSPQFRGQNVFPLIAQRCFEEYPDSEFYSCVSSDNIPSRRSHEKIGFRRCGVAYYLRFFQKTFCLFIPKKGKTRLLLLKRGQAAEVKLG